MRKIATQRQRALFLALLASLVLWNLPFGGVVLYPFKLFATWLHEMSHGVVMLLSGAGFDYLEIFQDTSGIAYAERSTGSVAQALIASAGYVGTAVFGAAFLILGQSRRGARTVLSAIGGALAVSAVFWIANDFGFVVTVGGSFVFLALGVLAGERIGYYVVNFVAAQSCINAVLDIRVLFRAKMVIDGEVVGSSDAHNMAEATFGNYWMWATVWLLFSFAVFYGALRVVYLRHERAISAPASSSSRPARSPAPAP